MANTTQDAFLICPMGEPGSQAHQRSNQLLEEIVRPILRRFGFETKCFLKPDHKNAHGIREEMRALIRDAAFCVADLTDHNANVHFEYGYRMAMRLPVLALIQEGQTPKFNVDDYHTVKYDLSKPAKARRDIQTFLTQKGFGNRDLEVAAERTSQNNAIREYIRDHKPRTIDVLQLSLATSLKDIFESIKFCTDLTMRIVLMHPEAAGRYALGKIHSADVEATERRISNIENDAKKYRYQAPTIGLWYYHHEPSIAALIMDDDFVQLGWYFREPDGSDAERMIVNGNGAPSVLAESDAARVVLKTAREHFNTVWTHAELVCLGGPKKAKLRSAWKALKRQ